MSNHLVSKIIYIDGSGNGDVCIIFEGQKPIVEKHSTNTHNESEWQALFSALAHIKSYELFTIFSDSQLVVNQFNGEYKTRNPRMFEWKNRCRRYINTHGLKVRVQWIERENNPAGEYLESLRKKITK